MCKKSVRGVVNAVDNLGTMVKLSIECKNGEMESIHFDHRMFYRMLDAEHSIVGREIEYRDGGIYFFDDKSGQYLPYRTIKKFDDDVWFE
jgi:hypothetical protein